MDMAAKIINNMPSDLNDLEKARYLYLELCKEVSFSTKFHNTDDKTMSSMFSAEVDVCNLKDMQVNCIMWSQLYSQLLDIIGIENNIIDMGHQFVEFNIDNKRWIADATYGTYTDLSRVKNDDETVGFGLSFFQSTDKHDRIVVINEEVSSILNQVDEKLGYNTNCKQNLLEFKDYLYQIKSGKVDVRSLSHADEMTEENEVCFKLEYLFSTIGKLKTGFYEQKDFIYHLEKIMLTEEERELVGAVELKKTNPDKSVDIVQCIYASCGDNFNYYLLAPNTKVQKYESEQITKLAMMGYGIENKVIPGIIYPKKFQSGKVSVDYRYRLYNFLNNRNLISEEPIFTNLEQSYKGK